MRRGYWRQDMYEMRMGSGNGKRLFEEKVCDDVVGPFVYMSVNLCMVSVSRAAESHLFT